MRNFGVFVVASLVVACQNDQATGDPSGDVVETDGLSDVRDGSGLVTWAEVAPLFARHCVSCHHEGGAAPFALDTFDGAAPYASAALAAVESGRMPPFPADVDCGEFAHANVVDSADLDRLRGWVAGGALPATDVDEPLQPPVFDSAFAAHLSATIGPYTPDAENPDDWRCFVTDLEFAEETWIKAARVVPDQLSVVHHALIYAVAAVDVPTILAADEDQEGAGYTCFGGPLPSSGTSGGTAGATGAGGFPNQLGAWVPGINAEPLPEGMARVVAPGSRIVVQMHYNTLTAEPVEDASTLELMTTPETPTLAATTVPVLQRNLDIPAGEANVVAEAIVTNTSSSEATFRAFMAHAHLLATVFEVDHLDADGASECLLHIPNWDFNWQQNYARPHDNLVTVAPGESLRLRCTFDNSAANQPVVNGEQIEPRDVAWGESTLDEMCLLYVDRVDPYEPPPAAEQPACASISTCAAACESGDLDCILACETTGTTCLTCTVRGSIGCGGAACIADVRAAQDCLVSCGVSLIVFGGSPGICMEQACPDQYAAVTECLGPVLADAACADVLEECGL